MPGLMWGRKLTPWQRKKNTTMEAVLNQAAASEKNINGTENRTKYP